MSDTAPPAARAAAALAGLAPSRTRYKVLAFVIAAYFITYIDRVLLSVSAPFIERDLGLSTITMGWVLFSYSIAYAAFQIPGGWFGDKVGPRLAMTCVVIWWSVFTALTSLTWSAMSMGVCLFLIGMGEAGAFPIANRALSRWMLPSERALAQGATHAGSRLGSTLTPIIVVGLVGVSALTWRLPFLIFAAVGIIWALLWYRYYRNSPADHAGVNEAELARINGALGIFKKGKRKVPWGQILSNRQMYVLGAMYFCYAYDIGVFLSWFPKYLNAARGIDLAQMGFYASVPFLAGLVGDITGGVVSDEILKKTGKLAFARRIVSVTGFWISAGAVTLAAWVDDPVVSICWFALALFALELTVGVSWAVTLDVGGEFAGSISAVMNTAGNIGAAIAVAVTARLATDHGWGSAFAVIAALAAVAGVLMLFVDPSRRFYRDEAGA
ncbi:MFS transporter [Sphingomonas quercus]|uniref:MFS transporter n=1 Tax=Sphingomonas quercus TaxID=2842451 RepID=UPI00342D555F